MDDANELQNQQIRHLEEKNEALKAEIEAKKANRRLGFADIQESIRTGVPIEDAAERLEATTEYIYDLMQQLMDGQQELLRLYEEEIVPSLRREMADVERKLAAASG